MTNVFPEVTLSAFALLHSVLQGQSCLLLQVSLDFLLLHSIHDEVVRGADRRMDCFILKNEETYNKRNPLVSNSGSHSESVGKRNISNFKLEGEQLLIASQWRQSELCNKGREICLPHPYTRGRHMPPCLEGPTIPSSWVWMKPALCGIRQPFQDSTNTHAGKIFQCMSVSLEVWRGRAGGRTEGQNKEVAQQNEVWLSRKQTLGVSAVDLYTFDKLTSQNMFFFFFF